MTASAEAGGAGGSHAAADVVVFGTVAQDRLIRLAGPLRAGCKQDGEDRGQRLGGGGANAAVALARAGRRVRLVAAVGKDEAGGRLVEELAREGVDVSLVRPVAGATPATLIFAGPDGERTVLRVTRLAHPDAAADLGGLCPGCLFVRGHAPGIDAVMRAALAGSLVAAQVPPCDDGALPAHLLVGSASDLGPEFLAGPFAAGRRVAGDALRWVVVTRGADGAEAYAADGARHVAPAARVDAVDTTGAGDAFAAGLIHALLAGRPIERALRTAVAWGTAAVLHEGSTPGRDFRPPDPD